MDLTGQEKCAKSKEFGNNGAVRITMRIWVLAQPSDGLKNPEVTLSLPQPVLQWSRPLLLSAGDNVEWRSKLLSWKKKRCRLWPLFSTLLTNPSNCKKKKRKEWKALATRSNVNQRQPGDNFEGDQRHWKEIYSVYGVASKTFSGKAKELSQGARLAMLFRSLLLVTSRQSQQ